MAKVLLPVLLVILSACSSDTVYLPALLADPMADYSHPSLEVSSRAEIPKGEQFTGAPRRPTVNMAFILTGAVDAVIADVITRAKGVGWVFESEEPATGTSGNRTWSAEKELPEGLARLRVLVLAPDAPEDWDLAVSLSFRESTDGLDLWRNCSECS